MKIDISTDTSGELVVRSDGEALAFGDVGLFADKIDRAEIVDEAVDYVRTLISRTLAARDAAHAAESAERYARD